MRAESISLGAPDSTHSLVEGQRYYGQVVGVDMALEQLETDQSMRARARYTVHFRMVGDTAKHFRLFLTALLWAARPTPRPVSAAD